MFNDNFYKIHDLVRKENSTLSDKIIKLGEEKGEIDEAFLRFNGYKKVDPSTGKKSGEDAREDISEECVDAIIMCLSILIDNNMTLSEIEDLMSAKIDKWKTKHLM